MAIRAVSRTVSSLVSTAATLTWQPGEGASAYDLYLWKTSESRPETPTAAGLTQTDYTPATPLESTTDYQWQVEAIGLLGNTPGPVWNLQTE